MPKQTQFHQLRQKIGWSVPHIRKLTGISIYTLYMWDTERLSPTAAVRTKVHPAPEGIIAWLQAVDATLATVALPKAASVTNAAGRTDANVSAENNGYMGRAKYAKLARLLITPRGKLTLKQAAAAFNLTTGTAYMRAYAKRRGWCFDGDKPSDPPRTKPAKRRGGFKAPPSTPGEPITSYWTS